MIDHLLRTPKRHLLRPLAARLPARPAPVTGAALALGVSAAATAATGAFGVTLALWLGNRFLDGLDGEIARVHGVQSDLGGYLDLLADFVVYALLPIGLALGAPSAPGDGTWAALAALLASFYLNAASWTLLSALLERRGRGATANGAPTSVTMPPALIEGSETIVLFALFALFPGALPWLFSLGALLVSVGVVQRAVAASRLLRAPREDA